MISCIVSRINITGYFQAIHTPVIFLLNSLWHARSGGKFWAIAHYPFPRTMKTNQFSGVFTALATPMLDDGIDYGWTHSWNISLQAALTASSQWEPQVPDSLMIARLWVVGATVKLLLARSPLSQEQDQLNNGPSIHKASRGRWCRWVPSSRAIIISSTQRVFISILRQWLRSQKSRSCSIRFVAAESKSRR